MVSGRASWRQRWRWVQYTAHYIQTRSSSGSAGNHTQENSVVDESRSRDGSLSFVKKVNGKAVLGKLWLTNGEMTELDYTRQNAIIGGKAPRMHLQMPKGAPTGNEVIAGLPCSVYPIHMKNGSGELCVDVADDILLKEELHFDGNGLHQDYVKQAASIDLATPVDSSTMKIPDGFKTLSAAH
jgi:hypothetical protein